MALILRVDGTQEIVQPENGTDFRLAQLYTIIGHPVEVVHLHDGRIMICNEEGKLTGMPRNEQATALCSFLSPEERVKVTAFYESMGIDVIDATGGEEDYIAGDVIVCEDKELQ